MMQLSPAGNDPAGVFLVKCADVTLLRFSRRAMATIFEIVIPWGTHHADKVANNSFGEIDAIESQLTVYRQDSEVARLNKLAAYAPVPVESQLFELLQQCATINRQTNGTFDITTGPLTKAWGFYQRQGRTPTVEELADAHRKVGMDKLMFVIDKQRLQFASPGVEINLGSIGKGFALDRAASMIKKQLPNSSVLLQAGGSSAYAIGRMPGEPRGWSVGIRHPWEPRRLGTLMLQDRAMASSGATHQHFQSHGRKLGHILDPRTGQPAVQSHLAVAVAPSAALADALSTAFFVLGLDGIREFCADHADIGALWLGVEGELVAVNLSDEVWSAGPPDDYYVSKSRDELE